MKSKEERHSLKLLLIDVFINLKLEGFITEMEYDKFIKVIKEVFE